MSSALSVFMAAVLLFCGDCIMAAEASRIAVRHAALGHPGVLEDCRPGQQRLAELEAREQPANEALYRHQPVPVRLIPATTLPPLEKEWSSSTRRVEPYGNRKVIALTFDLCETSSKRTGYDAAVVNVLKKYGARATFFAGGRWMQTHPDKAKQLMADPLFEIGNHSWSHANCTHLDGEGIRSQVLRTQAEYESLLEELLKDPSIGRLPLEKIPRVPCLFRFPYGACGPEGLRIVAEAGLRAIQWDVVMGDPVIGQAVSSIVDRVLRSARPGSIVVGHANGRGYGTAEALEIIIPSLGARGFGFVTVSELLLLGRVKAAEGCYELTPGDTLRYDKPAPKSRSPRAERQNGPLR